MRLETAAPVRLRQTERIVILFFVEDLDSKSFFSRFGAVLRY
jgi:hypothetical protein